MMKLLRRLLALAAVAVTFSPLSTCLPIESPAASTSKDHVPEVTLTIHTNKLAALVDERFLSMTVDPEQLIRHALPGPGSVRMMAMANAMSPAYLRIAGLSTENISFEGGPVSVGSQLSVKEQQWSQLQVLCRNAGLRPIIALSAHRRPGGGSRWDSRDAMRALASADSSALAPIGWQLGYDWKTLHAAGVQPSQAASDMSTLRSLISEFPTLAKEASMLFGPDADAVPSDVDDAAQLAKAANLAAVVLRPFTVDDPTGAKLDRDIINRVLGRGTSKKALWIAEQGAECTAPFQSGLMWAQRLCTATRVGAQVILRELDLDAVRDNATPDLWVSLLHKTLASRGVLDARSSGSGAATDLSVSSHCSPTDTESATLTATRRPGSPVIRYEPGSVTIMAVNPTSKNLRVSLRVAGLGSTGIVIGSPAVLAAADSGTLVHQFVLTPADGDLNSTSTLLNGSPLQMAPGGGIPILSPQQLQLNGSMLVSLPPHSVAFWVIPGAKARACLTPPASSDVAPAGSRLRPLSARDVELSVNLNDVDPMPQDAEPPNDADTSQAQESESGESGELPIIKDLRRRRKKLSRTATTPKIQIPLPRPAMAKQRSNFELPLGMRSRSSKEPESKTLDDFLREELELRPKTRAPFDVTKLHIPSLKQLDTSTMLNPLQLDLALGAAKKENTEAEKAEGLKTKRSTDDIGGINVDDSSRSRRKTMMDYMKEELQRKHKKTPSEETEKWVLSNEDDLENVQRSKRHQRRARRFVPEEIGLRLKRKLAAPDLQLNLPKLPKKPFLSPAAKRAQMLLSLDGAQGQKSDETLPNSWGSANREVFPQGDVFADTEGAYNQKPRDVDYVSDDDYPGPSKSRMPQFKPTDLSDVKSPDHDRFYFAPGEFYDLLVPNPPPTSAAQSRVAEFGELEHLPGRIPHNIDDGHVDTFPVVPAIKPNVEEEAQIRTKLKEDLERHYADVQKAAADRIAEARSDEEDDVAEPVMDLEKLRLLGKKYIEENKMTLPEEVLASINMNETKETGKASDTKHRRRRDLNEPTLNSNMDVPDVSPAIEHAPEMPLSRVTDDAWKRRQEKIKAFKEKLNKDNHDSKASATQAEQVRSVPTTHEIRQLIQSNSKNGKRKRAVEKYESTVVDGSHGLTWQTPLTQRYNPVLWDSTGAPLEPPLSNLKEEDLWPFSSYNGNGKISDNDNVSLMYPQPLIESFPRREINEDHSRKEYEESLRSKHSTNNHPSNPHRHLSRKSEFSDRSWSAERDICDSSEETIFDDGAYGPYYTARSSAVQGSKTFPNLVAIPWDLSMPSHIMYKRSLEESPSGTPNRLVQETSASATHADIADAIRKLHKVLNDEELSSEESVEVHNGQTLIDSPDTVDSLEDTIQLLLNMTKQLNETLKDDDHQEMIPWSEFGLNDTSPESPQLDAEEGKFRNAAVAWLHAVKEGFITPSKSNEGNEQNNSTLPNHLSVKKQLSGEESSEVVAEKLAHRRNLTEQENIISAMMQRVSALLSDLRSIFNKQRTD